MSGGTLYIASLGVYATNSDAVSIDNGFKIVDSIDAVNGQNIGCALAYLQTNAGTTANPTFTVAAGAPLAASLVSFG